MLPRMDMSSKCYVVGVDGSMMAATALRWAGRVAARSGTEIVAVNTFQNPWSEMTPDDHDRLFSEREELLATAWVQPAVDAGASVRTVVKQGDPRHCVLTVADDEDAELVVLGRTGSGGGPGFLHLGSVVEHAAHHTRRPLAVIPSTTAGSLDRIVVGVDGSPESLHALRWSGGLAALTGAVVLAVAVEESHARWVEDSTTENWRRDVERQIAEWTAPVAAAGISVDHVAQQDVHPADGLLGVASARAGDVVVIGTRGAGGFSGLRAGGVAMKVLHRASLPLVLVPPPA